MIPTLTAIGIGGNLGNREETYRLAVDTLQADPGLNIIRQSSWYETTPVGLHDQPMFLNGALAVESKLSPQALLTMLQGIEHDFGRIRTVPDGPRVLDLDLLLYDDLILDEPTLTIPHPRLEERAFVLVPLAEILPNAVHPVTHRTMAMLLADLGRVDHLVKPYDPMTLERPS